MGPFLWIWKPTNLCNKSVFSWIILLQLRWPILSQNYHRFCILCIMLGYTKWEYRSFTTKHQHSAVDVAINVSVANFGIDFGYLQPTAIAKRSVTYFLTKGLRIEGTFAQRWWDVYRPPLTGHDSNLERILTLSDTSTACGIVRRQCFVQRQS